MLAAFTCARATVACTPYPSVWTSGRPAWFTSSRMTSNRPNETTGDDERLIASIKSAYSTGCHVEKSVWLVTTEQSAGEARDTVKKLLYPTDILFVARLSGNWGSFNLGTKRTEWLKDRTF
jgi:hypothetical protein